MKKFVIAFCLCVMMGALQGCGPGGATRGTDLDFAKTTLGLLANGDTAAEGMLDWENFQSMGMNVGSIYISMSGDTQKAAFRKSFIKSFSTSFKGTGAKVESLANWRVQEEDAGKTIVAADTLKNGSILLTVSKIGGAQKVSALNIAAK